MDPTLHGSGTVDLTKALIDRVTSLARKEVELARLELEEDAKRTRASAELGGTAAAALIAALACALIAVVDGLAHFMPHWLAAVICTVVFVAVGAFLARGALAKLKSARPKRSIREAKATFRMLTERVS